MQISIKKCLCLSSECRRAQCKAFALRMPQKQVSKTRRQKVAIFCYRNRIGIKRRSKAAKKKQKYQKLQIIVSLRGRAERNITFMPRLQACDGGWVMTCYCCIAISVVVSISKKRPSNILLLLLLLPNDPLIIHPFIYPSLHNKNMLPVVYSDATRLNYIVVKPTSGVCNTSGFAPNVTNIL